MKAERLGLIASLVFVATFVVVAILVAERTKSTGVETKLKPDPVASFEGFCDRLVPALRSAHRAHGAFEKGAGSGATIEIGTTWSVDVTKSDSLVSPYVGTVRIPERQTSRGFDGAPFSMDYFYILSFASHDGHWSLASAKEEQHSPISPTETFDMLANPKVWAERTSVIKSAVLATDSGQ
jgi:hypothetical protein